MSPTNAHSAASALARINSRHRRLGIADGYVRPAVLDLDLDFVKTAASFDASRALRSLTMDRSVVEAVRGLAAAQRTFPDLSGTLRVAAAADSVAKLAGTNRVAIEAASTLGGLSTLGQILDSPRLFDLAQAFDGLDETMDVESADLVETLDSPAQATALGRSDDEAGIVLAFLIPAVMAYAEEAGISGAQLGSLLLALMLVVLAVRRT